MFLHEPGAGAACFVQVLGKADAASETCGMWFLLPRQSFIHDVSSADPSGLKALFERTLQ